jgi:exodeoxyribonuclease V alpha subunit
MMGKWALTSGFSEGDPVMFTKNNWDRNLLNGTLGFIVEAYDPPRTQHDDPSAHICARIFFDTGPQDMTACDFSNLELAYAITVHKAQGSQFKRLIITIKKGHLLDKALIYTGITRGIEQVVLVGDIEAAREAVEGGAAADTRQVGLGRLLIKALAGEPV